MPEKSESRSEGVLETGDHEVLCFPVADGGSAGEGAVLSSAFGALAAGLAYSGKAAVSRKHHPRPADRLPRLGTRLVGSPRSAKPTSVADWSRSRPIGGLNLPARTVNAGVNVASQYASKRVGDVPPKSGIRHASKYLPTAASRIGRARRISRSSTFAPRHHGERNARRPGNSRGT